MAYPDSTTLAPALGGSVKNVALQPKAGSMVRTGLIIATYDPAKTGVNNNVAKQYLSSEAVADELGWGFPVHILAKEFFKYGKGIKLCVAPQAEASGAVAATGTIKAAVSSLEAGTANLYIADNKVPVAITAAMTADNVAAAIAAAITADKTLPVTASATTDTVTLTSKAKGTFGNYITVDANLDGENLPTGLTLTITDMEHGATDPDVADALNALGTGDASNGIGVTGIVTGYAPTNALFQALSTYNGIGDQKVGCYAKTVGRPFRALHVSTVAGSTGFTAMKAITDVNLLDRTNSFVGVPNSYRHPASIAAQILGYTESTTQAHAHASFVGAPLGGHVNKADVWTDEGTSRDTAIKSGISTTRVDNNVLVIDGLVTMYRPNTIPVNNNAYRSFRNIGILQNILKNHRDTWLSRPSFTVVKDAATVDPREKSGVLDEAGVKGINTLMVQGWGKQAWLFDAEYTVKNQMVALRLANNGFDIVLPIILSAEGVVSDTVVETDIDLSVN